MAATATHVFTIAAFGLCSVVWFWVAIDSWLDQDDETGLAKWHFRFVLAVLCALIAALLIDRGAQP